MYLLNTGSRVRISPGANLSVESIDRFLGHGRIFSADTCCLAREIKLDDQGKRPASAGLSFSICCRHYLQVKVEVDYLWFRVRLTEVDLSVERSVLRS